MQRIINEDIRAKIKQSIYQGDTDDILTNMKMLTIISLMQSISEHFILLETCRNDTSSKIEQPLIELHFIDEKGV